MFLRVQFLALFFSPCILSLCLPLLTHTIIHHSFADDLQLQMSAPPDRISELLHSMQSCMGDVKAWATTNMLNCMPILMLLYIMLAYIILLAALSNAVCLNNASFFCH